MQAKIAGRQTLAARSRQFVERRAPVFRLPGMHAGIVIAGIAQPLEEARRRGVGDIGLGRQLTGSEARKIGLRLHHHRRQTPLTGRQLVIDRHDPHIDRTTVFLLAHFISIFIKSQLRKFFFILC